jgi:hypothetical protein
MSCLSAPLRGLLSTNGQLAVLRSLLTSRRAPPRRRHDAATPHTVRVHSDVREPGVRPSVTRGARPASARTVGDCLVRSLAAPPALDASVDTFVQEPELPMGLPRRGDWVATSGSRKNSPRRPMTSEAPHDGEGGAGRRVPPAWRCEHRGRPVVDGRTRASGPARRGRDPASVPSLPLPPRCGTGARPGSGRAGGCSRAPSEGLAGRDAVAHAVLGGEGPSAPRPKSRTRHAIYDV